MKYTKKKILIEKVSAIKLAKKYSTPLYCYSFEKLKNNINNFKNNFKSFNPLICFSVKSNSNINILREIKRFDCGADVVSIGELMMALKAGINPKKIVFSGVGKTFQELNYAINKNILLINVESKSEMLQIEKILRLKKKKINVGIRLNPNIDAKTINKISTGKKEDKFGLTEKNFIELANYVKNSKYINLICLSVHIGSQIINNLPYEKMLNTVSQIIKKVNHNFEFIDLGGGMGIPYENKIKKFNYKKYNYAINKFLKKHKSRIIFEPGRSLIGDTAVLISKVIYIKKTNNKNFIILDAAMNDLMRPALYGSKHRIIPVVKKDKKTNKTYEFVGPICESTDKFLTLKKFQKLKENDLIIICDVGAYGMSLSSNYNLRPKPMEILIKGSKINIIKKRQRLLDLI